MQTLKSKSRGKNNELNISIPFIGKFLGSMSFVNKAYYFKINYFRNIVDTKALYLLAY